MVARGHRHVHLAIVVLVAALAGCLQSGGDGSLPVLSSFQDCPIPERGWSAPCGVSEAQEVTPVAPPDNAICLRTYSIGDGVGSYYEWMYAPVEDRRYLHYYFGDVYYNRVVEGGAVSTVLRIDWEDGERTLLVWEQEQGPMWIPLPGPSGPAGDWNYTLAIVSYAYNLSGAARSAQPVWHWGDEGVEGGVLDLVHAVPTPEGTALFGSQYPMPEPFSNSTRVPVAVEGEDFSFEAVVRTVTIGGGNVEGLYPTCTLDGPSGPGGGQPSPSLVSSPNADRLR